MMNKKRTLHLMGLIFSAGLLLVLGLAYPTLAQGPTPSWIIWEMENPPQSLQLDGNTLWLGSYKGGLYQWDIQQGYQAHYTTTHGLPGDDIVGLTLAGGGNPLLAALDGGLASGSGPFNDLTPPNGQKAWDIAVADNGDIWLATMGGGVAHYDGSIWTEYNSANSSLPFDDIYAVAVEGTTPWVGTVGYGLARFDGTDWVTYTLPVNIVHPLTETNTISNNAIVDISIDSSGNKWLASDGSGVVVLDNSNSTWTVYNSSATSLPDDFVHTVYLEGDDPWFGTLGGGAAHLSGGSWSLLNTNNSLLPEDDVLALAVDANSGQWFASFDTGLSYHGSLPATAPLLDINPRDAPAYRPGQAKSYYLWLDPDTYIWHLAWSGDGSDHTFAGAIQADAPIISATATHFEGADSHSVSGNILTIAATEAISHDLVSFVLDRSATELTVDLLIDGAYRPFNIKIGATEALPPTAPFRLLTPQPQPPQVSLDDPQTIEEGDLLFVRAALTDTDSPVGHQISWDMADGATLTDTLAINHSYEDDGLFDITLTITDVHQEVSSVGQTVTVTNVAPEVYFDYEPARPEPGQTITFSAEIYDPGLADSHTYLWDFDDGASSASDLTVSHSYAQSGTYDVFLTVTDDDGGVGVISYPISIDPFGADFIGYPGVGLPPFTATFYGVSYGLVQTRTWDFGDGSPAVVTTTTDIDHLYDTPGIYDVSLTIEGPSGIDTITRPEYIVAVSPLADGTVILEAEDFTRSFPASSAAWEVGSIQPGYSGNGYVEAGPDVDLLYDTSAIGDGTELQYDLGLTITGTYAIWLRGYAPNAAGDSIYVGLNYDPITSTDYISEFTPRTWTWRHTLTESGQPATLTIDDPAVHTLHLWLREDGLIIDQIILTTDTNFDPEG